MFDRVNYHANCYKCGEPLGEFQSKSGYCKLRDLEPGELYDEAGLSASFYSYCDKCGLFNEFKMKPITQVKVVRVEHELEEQP